MIQLTCTWNNHDFTIEVTNMWFVDESTYMTYDGTWVTEPRPHIPFKIGNDLRNRMEEFRLQVMYDETNDNLKEWVDKTCIADKKLSRQHAQAKQCILTDTETGEHAYLVNITPIEVHENTITLQADFITYNKAILGE